MMTLDANSTVWTFRNWGRPFRLVSPLLDCSSPETTPVHIECGGKFSAVLTRPGDVYMWWPFDGTMQNKYEEAMAELDKDESTKAVVPDGGMVIPCYTWEIHEDPIKLSILPNLPNLSGTGLPEEECRKETKLIKIAALNDSLIGLTNKGHVLKMDGLGMKGSTQVWNYVSENVRMIWHSLNHDIQLPNYSEIDRVKKHPAFQRQDTMLITHVNHVTLISSEFCI